MSGRRRATAVGEFVMSVCDLAGTMSIVLTGDVDAGAAPSIEARIREAIGAGPCDVTVDLSGTTFLDSSGLRVLLTAHRLVDDAGHRMRVLAPSPPVRRILEITGLDDHFHVVESP